MPCALQARPVGPCDGAATCDVGAMSFVRGAELNCADHHFGGVSGLAALSSTSLLAITDQGSYFELPIWPRTGETVDVRLLDYGSGGHDVESVAVLPDRSASFVGIEGSGEVRKYAGVLSGAGAANPVLKGAAWGDCAAQNEMYESLVLLDAQHLLAICESNGKGVVYSMAKDAIVRRFAYPSVDWLQPSEATSLGRGRGILVLERRFSWGQTGKVRPGPRVHSPV